MNYSLYKELLAVEFEVKLELVFFLSPNFCELSFIFFPFVHFQTFANKHSFLLLCPHLFHEKTPSTILKNVLLFHMFHVEIQRISNRILNTRLERAMWKCKLRCSVEFSHILFLATVRPGWNIIKGTVAWDVFYRSNLSRVWVQHFLALVRNSCRFFNFNFSGFFAV